MTRKKRNRDHVKFTGSFLLALILTSSAYAQLIEFPLHSTKSESNRRHSANKVNSLLTITYPFWDDFSYTDTLSYPDENLWQFGKSVFLNSGTGVEPPSKNVITFDGVDSVGKPYNVNDILAKGLADKVVSQNIRLDLVDVAQRPTTYLSFFYQLKGHGESPDPGDQLLVSFKKPDGAWETRYTIDNDGSQDPLVFYQVLVPIDSDYYFHDAFQFRIQNFARLSGPYDTWNVDYVYLNQGRSPTDTSYPDRTVSMPMNSLFNDYYAMPVRHFLLDPAANMKHPSLELYNLSVGNTQPFDYTTNARIATRINGTVTSNTINLDVAQDPGTLLNGLEYQTLTLNTIPPVLAFDPLADSIGIELEYGMSTKDNKSIALGGDYDDAKYSPIEFRTNDTVRTRYTLSSYYAYDDGIAEYGAGLNQAGSYLAAKFSLSQVLGDTLVYVDIYFPEFGDNTAQSLLLQVRNQLDDLESSILHQETIQVERKTQNRFSRYPLLQPVTVGQEFFVSWKQVTNASIPVGLDKNNDHGDKVYYNTNGTWVQNTTVVGSLMMRPGFGPGNGTGIVTGLEKTVVTPIYPNPAKGICYLPLQADEIVAYNIQGQVLNIDIQSEYDRRAILFPSQLQGMVIIQYAIDGKLKREKIMVQGQ